jgi:hypothetical protein
MIAPADFTAAGSHATAHNCTAYGTPALCSSLISDSIKPLWFKYLAYVVTGPSPDSDKIVVFILPGRIIRGGAHANILKIKG